jgi:hypothetical protein
MRLGSAHIHSFQVGTPFTWLAVQSQCCFLLPLLLDKGTALDILQVPCEFNFLKTGHKQSKLKQQLLILCMFCRKLHLHLNYSGQLRQYSDQATDWTTAVQFPASAMMGFLLFATASSPAPRPTQWLHGVLTGGVKRPGREPDYSPPLMRGEECVELHLHSHDTS